MKKRVCIALGGGKRCPYRGVCCRRFLHFHINFLGHEGVYNYPSTV